MNVQPASRFNLEACGATDVGMKRRLNEDVFVLGDATDLPTSKAGSVAHFEAEVLAENILRQIEGQKLVEDFDGHANCFIESGFGKGILIDFNYDTEPLPGKFPLPGVGPFSLHSLDGLPGRFVRAMVVQRDRIAAGRQRVGHHVADPPLAAAGNQGHFTADVE